MSLLIGLDGPLLFFVYLICLVVLTNFFVLGISQEPNKLGSCYTAHGFLVWNFAKTIRKVKCNLTTNHQALIPAVVKMASLHCSWSHHNFGGISHQLCIFTCSSLYLVYARWCGLYSVGFSWCSNVAVQCGHAAALSSSLNALWILDLMLTCLIQHAFCVHVVDVRMVGMHWCLLHKMDTMLLLIAWYLLVPPVKGKMR